MTHSAAQLVESVESRLSQSGFLSYGKIKLGKRLGDGLTLHEVIRSPLGMKPDDSIYMYWEWRELKPALDALWSAFDAAASKVEGRTTSAIAYASDESRTAEEMLRMLSEVVTSSMVAFPTVTRRPTKSESQVRFVGKLLGATLMTIGILEEARESGFGDLFTSLSSLSHDEVEFLYQIDSQVREAYGDLAKAPTPSSVVVLRALGWAFEETNETRAAEDLPHLTLGGFLRETEESANWAGLSDAVVLRRLLAIAPEKAETSIKAIEKFLSN